jgi:hypothetical protein
MVHFNGKNKQSQRQDKRDRVVNLTDMGRHNSMKASLVRDLQDDGTYKLRAVNWDGSLIPEENPEDPNSIEGVEGNTSSQQQQQRRQSQVFIVAHEAKGSSYSESYQPPTDIEPGYEEYLEATGATIINSTTYFPASKTTISKRSQTPANVAEEMGYHDFHETY